jgi:hypothetical protein
VRVPTRAARRHSALADGAGAAGAGAATGSVRPVTAACSAAAPGGCRAERLGDAEVEQLGLALGGDEDVRRLEVAVHDSDGMRHGHRVAHAREERQAVGQRRLPRGAPRVDRHPLDVLHRVPRHARLGDAAVEQPRDARMVEPREDLPLGREAAHEGVVAMQPAAHQLERDPHAEGAVVALGHEHLAHAARARPRAEAPGPHAVRHLGRRRRVVLPRGADGAGRTRQPRARRALRRRAAPPTRRRTCSPACASGPCAASSCAASSRSTSARSAGSSAQAALR